MAQINDKAYSCLRQGFEAALTGQVGGLKLITIILQVDISIHVITFVLQENLLTHAGSERWQGFNQQQCI